MPERPDLEYVVPRLDVLLKDAPITAVTVKKAVVLRLAVEGSVEQALTGRVFTAVTRRGHFLMFALRGPPPELEMVVSPMLAGRFSVDPGDSKAPGDTAMAFGLQDGRVLRYRDSEQMGKVYVIPKGNHAQVPGLEKQGLDVLNPKVFTREAFRAVAQKRRDQAKVFLMDKAALDSFGNAYADEALWEAGVHPKTMMKSLSAEELDRLHDAMVKVLGDACAEIVRRQPPLEEKVRDFLKVRNKHGEVCPRCGSKVRKAGVHGHDAFFCPQCQPETRKGSLVDWRKTGI